VGFRRPRYVRRQKWRDIHAVVLWPMVLMFTPVQYDHVAGIEGGIMEYNYGMKFHHLLDGVIFA